MNKSIEVLKSYQAVFYFNEYEGKDGIIWGLKSYDDMNIMFKLVRWILADKRKKEEKKHYNIMSKFIKDNGSKFYVSCGHERIYGYYYNKDQPIDFEPVDLVTKNDLGYNALFWLNPSTKEYELVG